MGNFKGLKFSSRLVCRGRLVQDWRAIHFRALIACENSQLLIIVVLTVKNWWWVLGGVRTLVLNLSSRDMRTKGNWDMWRVPRSVSSF